MEGVFIQVALVEKYVFLGENGYLQFKLLQFVYSNSWWCWALLRDTSIIKHQVLDLVLQRQRNKILLHSNGGFYDRYFTVSNYFTNTVSISYRTMFSLIVLNILPSMIVLGSLIIFHYKITCILVSMGQTRKLTFCLHGP